MTPYILMPALADAPQGGGAGLVSFVPLILMFIIFYFLLLRPQINRQRQHEKLVKDLNPKDKVVLNCGLYGTIVKVQESDIIVEVADKVHMKFQRSAVSVIRNRGGEDAKS